MIESYLLRFPLELIGAAVVALATVAVALGLLVAAMMAVLFVWIRGFTFVSNLMWRGYDPSDLDYPPLYRRRVAGVTLALARFKFRKILPAWREAEEMGDDDVTVSHAIRNYVNEVFLDE